MCTWKVKTFRDRGANEHYRWSVQGDVIDPPNLPQPFSWQVPSVTNSEKWDMSEAVEVSRDGRPVDATS